MVSGFSPRLATGETDPLYLTGSDLVRRVAVIDELQTQSAVDPHDPRDEVVVSDAGDADALPSPCEMLLETCPSVFGGLLRVGFHRSECPLETVDDALGDHLRSHA